MFIALSLDYSVKTMEVFDTDTGSVRNLRLGSVHCRNMVSYIGMGLGYQYVMNYIDFSFACKARDIAYNIENGNLYFRGYCYSLYRCSIVTFYLEDGTLRLELVAYGSVIDVVASDGVLVYRKASGVFVNGEPCSYSGFCKQLVGG